MYFPVLQFKRWMRAMVGLTLLCGASFSMAQTGQILKPIIIGSGGPLGNYYPTALGICRFVNKGINLHGISCHTETSAGSVANIDALRRGDIDYGLAQGDVLLAAKLGLTNFEEATAYVGLRSVAYLYNETYTVLVRKDSSAESFEDLKGKRINIGLPGSGQHKVSNNIVTSLGWTESDTRYFTEIPPSEQTEALCKGNTDAFVMVIGHPTPQLYAEQLPCDVRWIGFSEDNLAVILDQHPEFSLVTVDTRMYPFGAPRGSTIGIGAYLVTRDTTPAEQVFTILETISAHLDTLGLLSPPMKNTSRDMLKPSEHPVFPALHEGSIRFFANSE